MKLFKSIMTLAILLNCQMGYNQINVKAKVDHLAIDGLDSLGNIFLTVSGGTSPYSYTWAPGNLTAKDYTNTPYGTYSLNVVDNTSNTASYSYNLGYKSTWKNFYNCISRNDSLIADATGGVYRSALSKNVLRPNINGWVEMIYHPSFYLSVLGLLDSGYVANQGDIYDFDIAVHVSYGNVLYVTDGSSWFYIGSITYGDVLRIERVDNVFYVRQNNSVVYTLAGNSGNLQVKGLFGSGSIVDVGTSFSDTTKRYPLKLTANIDHVKTDDIDTLGLIKLNITGGNPPYSVNWLPNNLANDDDLYGTIDSYTASVSDGNHDTLTYKCSLGYKTNWSNYYGSISRNDSLISDETSGYVNRSAVSSNILRPNSDGWVEMIVRSVNIPCVLGFLDSMIVDNQGDAGDIDIGVHVTYDNAFYVWNGYYWNYIGSAENGDVLRIERISDMYYIKQNDSIVYSLDAINSSLRVKGLIYYSSLVEIGVSFADSSSTNPLRVVGLPDHIKPDGFDSKGGFNLQVSGGATPYSYTWLPGNVTTKNRLDLSIGTYTVKVKDLNNDSLIYKYNLGRKIEWNNYYGAISRNDSLISDGEAGYANRTAVSRNILKQNTDGYTEMIFHESSVPFLYGFLDSVMVSYQAYHYDYDFTLYVTYGNYLYIYNGSSFIGIGVINEGDVLRIERTSNVFYAKVNDAVVYSEAGINKDLCVKGLIYNSSLVKPGCSFNTPFEYSIDKDHSEYSNLNSGYIAVAPYYGQGDVKVLWNDGDTSSFRSGLSPGSYSLEITDNINGTTIDKTVTIGVQPLWRNLRNINLTTDSIWNEQSDSIGVALASNVIHNEVDGWFELSNNQYEQDACIALIGLTPSQIDTNYTVPVYSDSIMNIKLNAAQNLMKLAITNSLSYGSGNLLSLGSDYANLSMVRIHNGQVSLLLNGSNRDSLFNYSQNDILRIGRDNTGKIYFAVNDVVKYTQQTDFSDLYLYPTILTGTSLKVKAIGMVSGPLNPNFPISELETEPTCGSDYYKNYSITRTFKESSQMVDEIIQYYDNFGRPTQVQSKFDSKKNIMAAESIYDSYGRAVGQTMSAPLYKQMFCYEPLFFANPSNTHYNVDDHDKIITNSNLSGELNNPKTLNNSYKGNLGWYYSNNNNVEPNVASDNYPYSRVQLSNDPLNRPVKSSDVGLNHKMGSGHESTITYSLAFNELEKIYKSNTYELDQNFNPKSYPKLSPPYNEVPKLLFSNINKTIQLNEDGHDFVTYRNEAGQVLATCVSGDDIGCSGSEVKNIIPTNSYQVVHLSKAQLGTLKFISYQTMSNAEGPNASFLQPVLKLYNTKYVLVQGVDYSLSTNANNERVVTFSSTYLNQDLFLEVYCTLPSNAPYPNATIEERHIQSYTQWNVNYYDIKGRLKATQSPNDVVCGEQPSSLSSFFMKGSPISCDNNPILNVNVTQLIADAPTTQFESIKLSLSPEFTLFDTLVNLSQSSAFVFQSNDTLAPKDSLIYFENVNSDTLSYFYPDSIRHYASSFSDSDYVRMRDYNNTHISHQLYGKSINIKGNYYYSISKSGATYSFTDNPIPFDYDIILDGPNSKIQDNKLSAINITGTVNLSGANNILITTGDVSIKLKGFPGAPISVFSPCDLNMFVDSTNAKMISNINNNVTIQSSIMAAAVPSNPVPVATFTKKFYYNEYDHLIATESIDEGRTDFLYDLKEDKLMFSQNDKQRANGNKFSYIRYDLLGRVVETGEYDPTKTNLLTSYNYSFQPYASYKQYGVPSNPNIISVAAIAAANTDIVYITSGNPRFTQQNYVSYDIASTGPVNLAGAAFAQKHTQGKISATFNDNTTTYYSYNERGELKHTVTYLNGYEAKTMEYYYDLRGKLTKTIYQRNGTDVLSHEYSYDADERLTNANFRLGVSTSSSWGPIANYAYYQHGPLKREVLGRNIQGLDYIYTLGGLLKSINNPISNGYTTLDPGYDGLANTLPVDMYALGLEYFPGDYVRQGSLLNNTKVNSAYNNLNVSYTGMIHAQRWFKATNPGNGASVPSPNISGYLMYEYNFDELYRLTAAQFCNYSITAPTISGDPNTLNTTPIGAYKLTNISYDRNGNIGTLKRYAEKTSGQVLMDDLTYNYYSGQKNLLYTVTDAITTNNGFNAETDFPNQTGYNYLHNQIGETVHNVQDNQKYEYNYSGLVTVIRKYTNNTKIVEFTYNDKNLRHTKTTFSTDGLALIRTYYVYDASGALLALYDRDLTLPEGGSPVLSKWVIYANGRKGLLDATSKTIDFELTDQVGNVRMVLEDVGTIGSFPGTPALKQSTDYYPHGGPLPGRNFISGPSYLFALQGQEKDVETGLTNFELRQMDPRLGRWLNPDPYGQHYSPYLAMSNNPVNSVDPDGGWDDGYDPASGMTYTEWTSRKNNPDAYYQSESDIDWAHMSGSLGGGVNADGSFTSNNQMIKDAQESWASNHMNKSLVSQDGQVGVMGTIGVTTRSQGHIGFIPLGLDGGGDPIETKMLKFTIGFGKGAWQSTKDIATFGKGLFTGESYPKIVHGVVGFAKWYKEGVMIDMRDPNWDVWGRRMDAVRTFVQNATSEDLGYGLGYAFTSRKIANFTTFKANNGYGLGYGKKIELMYRNPSQKWGGTLISVNTGATKFRLDFHGNLFPKFHMHTNKFGYSTNDHISIMPWSFGDRVKIY